MDLMETLLFQDRNQLVQLLNTYDTTCNRNSKREVIEELYPKLLDEGAAQSIFMHLSESAKSLIMQCCFHEKFVFSKVELSAMVTSTGKSNYKKVLNELITVGWLFPTVIDSYVIPAQVKKRLKEVSLLPVLQSALFVPQEDGMDNMFSFCNDLLTFIDYISESSLPLTKTGILHKRDFHIIINQFDKKEEMPNEQWRFGYGRHFHHYPSRFSLIYDYCYMKGWIQESPEQLLVTTDKIKELDRMTPSALMQDVVRYWLKLYKQAVPQFPFLYSYLKACLQEGKAVSTEMVINILRPCISQYYFDSENDIITKRLFGMLNHLEIIRFIDVSGEVYVTPSKAYPMLTTL
ncbi:hypothetical protein ACJ2A9_10115 [Anaerobacillus sp. MEB173]|uniref:hypothetical protein n=1 Tax=Anaerobacillus sp. MEB173 TaxID=3383345 RepID=UPI003F925B43